MTTNAIKAIETEYKNYRFRSRGEARYAVLFDALDVKWEYEKEGYDIGGVKYLPDFWLPDFDLFAEVKGDECFEEDWEKVRALNKATGKQVVVLYSLGSGKGCANWEGVSRAVTTDPSHVAQLFSGNDEDFGAQLLCPICQYDYVHFGDPESKSSDEYTAWMGRGGAVRIPMSCENGCTWDLRIGFHKGNSFAEIENAKTHETDFLLYLAGFDRGRLAKAIKAALGARFEHGESGGAA